MTHKEYKSLRFEKKNKSERKWKERNKVRNKMKGMQSKSHQLGTYEVNKIFLILIKSDIHSMIGLKINHMNIKILIAFVDSKS